MKSTTSPAFSPASSCYGDVHSDRSSRHRRPARGRTDAPLVEQKVTVDVWTFRFSDSAQTYQCDGTGSSGTTTTPSPTRNGALAEAAERGRFDLLGSFGRSGASFTRINGEAAGFERFVATRRCGVKNARTFSAGTNARFSYLLPSALPAGRYVLDVVVLDRANNQTKTCLRGRNRVVFLVR